MSVIKKKLEEILRNKFKLETPLIKKLFTNKISIFDIPNWDSLQTLKFYLTIEKVFKIKINNKNFNKLNNLNKIIKFLEKMKSICIIPARGGSKRIKNKNIKNFWQATNLLLN